MAVELGKVAVNFMGFTNDNEERTNEILTLLVKDVKHKLNKFEETQNQLILEEMTEEERREYDNSRAAKSVKVRDTNAGKLVLHGTIAHAIMNPFKPGNRDERGKQRNVHERGKPKSFLILLSMNVDDYRSVVYQSGATEEPVPCSCCCGM